MTDFASLVIGVNTEGLKKGERALDATTRAAVRTEKSSDKASRGLKGMGLTAGGVATKGLNSLKAAAAGAVGALVGIGVGVRVIREFESSVSRMGAISGATTIQLKAMRDVAQDLGSTTEFSATQAADGLTFLAMAGFNASEAMASIPAVLDLATAAGMGLAEAADTASNIMSGFGIAATDAAKVTDILAAASSRSNTSVSQLGAAMSTVAPIASALDISLADTAAALGVLADAGIQGERGGTAFRGVLASLAGPTSQAEDVIKKLGLTISEVDPATNSLSIVMGRLGDVGLSTADAMTIFGREAASGALVMIDSAKRVGEFGDELDKANGASKEMADTIRDNLGGDIDGLVSAVSGLMIALGDAGLTAVLRGVTQVFTGMVRGLTALTDGFSSVKTWVLNLGSFENSVERVANANDVANLAISDHLAQVNALGVVSKGGRIVSLDYAGALLETAKASLSAAEATRQNTLASTEAKPEFQELIKDQARYTAELAKFQDVLSENPSEKALELIEFFKTPFDPTGLDGLLVSYERMRVKLVETVEQQEILRGTVGGTSEALETARDKLAEVQEAIRIAKGGAVVLGGAISDAADTTGSLARLAGGLATEVRGIAGAMGAAANNAATFVQNLGNANLSGLRASVAALRSGGTDRDSFEAGIRGSDEFQLALTGPAGLASAAMARLNAELENFDLKAERASIMSDRMAIATGGAGGGGGAARAVSDLSSEIERLEFDADPMKKYNAELANLDTLLANGLSPDAYKKAVDDLNKSLEETSPIVDSVANAFGDFMVNGFKDFQGFTRSIIDSFKSMLSQMIATAAKNKIMIAIGMGSGVAGSAAQANGIAGSVAGSMGGMFLKGATNAIGAFSGGIMAGFESIATAASMATGSMGMFAAAAGAIAVPIAAAVAVFSLFKKSTKTLDEGIKITTNGMDSLIESFKKIETSRVFGLFKSVSTSESEIGAAADPLRETIGQIQTSIMSAASVFGFGADAFAGFSHEFTLSLKGLDEAAQQSAIAEELTNLGNAFAGMTGAFATTQELVAAATQNYALQNRLLEAQGNSTELLARRRKAEMDATHELNQPLLARINLLADEAVATEAANAAMQAAVDAAMQGAVDAALAPIDGLLEASRSAASVARNSANEFFRLADSLREASGGIGGVTTAADLANEGQKFAQMFAAAVSGDVEALNSLGSAGQSLAGNSAGFASSAVELKRMEAGIRSQLEQGAAVAGGMGFGANSQALAYEAQTATLQVTKDLLMSGEITVDLLRQQITLLSSIAGVSTGVAGLNGLLNDLISVQLLQNSGFEAMTVALNGAVSFSSPITGNTSGMITFAPDTLPSFASGGSHTGGMRIVGENGPELEFTGPSQILNANQTKAAISGNSQGNSDAGVRSDLADLRRVMVEVVKYVKRTADIERKHDIDGTPAVRT